MEKISPVDEEREKKLSSLGYLKGADLSKIKQKDPDEAMVVLAKLEKARSEYLFGDLNIALNLYNELLEEFPSSSVILDERGLILYSLGKKEEARKSFELSLKYFPGNFNALINLANYYSQEGKLKEAIAYYEKASALKPQDPDLLFNYAATCANSGEMKKAKELFKKYLKLYPDDPEKAKIEEFLKK
ncbi:MAG: tetratricopeptide repeat protein [Thermoanaerobaculia bacterium]